MSWSQALECATWAVREELVEKVWCEAMRRAGLHGDAEGMAVELQAVLADMDVAPRPPSIDELGLVLGRQGPTTERMRAELLAPLKPRSGAAVSMPPPDPGAGAAGQSHAAGAVRPMGGPSASSLAREPPPQPGGNRLWLPRGRRLFFPCRGNVRLDERVEQVGPRPCTRSQGRALWLGHLEAERPTRRRR